MKQNVICIIRIPCLVLMASSDFELEKPTEPQLRCRRAPAEKTPKPFLFKNKYGMSTLTFHGVSWLTQTFESAHVFIFSLLQL